MSRIDTGREVYQKGAKQVSTKVKPDPRYMREVKQMPCVICNAPAPSDAHHCTHKPDAGGHNPYDREPCAARRSGDRDTIPLCKRHHQNGPEAIHNGKESWKRKHGPDFHHIPAIRARVAAALGEIEF